MRRMSVPFEEALQQAVWDLAAKAAGLPLWKMLGARRDRVRAYASALDFHLSDEDFGALFAAAAEPGYPAFKLKVGHAELDSAIHRHYPLNPHPAKDYTVQTDPHQP